MGTIRLNLGKNNGISLLMKTTTTSNSPKKKKLSYSTWIVGSPYKEHKTSEIRKHARSLFRLTYRKDIPPLTPYDYTSDSGWGCMLRSAQMLMASAMQRHFLGASWRLCDDIQERRKNTKYCDILRLFMDYPGSSNHMYALHNMVQAGGLYEKLPGEWFGPSTAAYVLRDLAREHRRKYGGPLELLVTAGDTVYISEAEAICTADVQNQGDDSEINTKVESVKKKPTIERNQQSQTVSSDHQTDNVDAVQRQVRQLLLQRDQGRANRSLLETSNGDGQLLEHNQRTGQHTSTSATTTTTTTPFFDPLFRPPPAKEQKPWKCALVVCVALRLGLQSVNSEYIEELKEICQNPYFIGFIGGKPNRALFFAGYREPSTFLGLDPHTTYSNPIRPVNNDPFPTLEHFNQVHVSAFEELDVAQLDPSLALGFYFRSREEFSSFCDQMKATAREKAAVGKNPLFVIEFAPPSYDDVDNRCMEDEEDDGCGGNTVSKKGEVKLGGGIAATAPSENDDEDDFVLI